MKRPTLIGIGSVVVLCLLLAITVLVPVQQRRARQVAEQADRWAGILGQPWTEFVFVETSRDG